MGRTLPAFRPCLEREIVSWVNYKRTLRQPDQEHFETLMVHARKHADAGSMVAKSSVMEIILLSIVLEQEKALKKLEVEVNKLKEDIKVNHDE